MKKFLLGSVALAALGIGAPAIAADMAVRPVAAAPAFSWTGCHFGGIFGYEWGHADGYTTTAASAVVSNTSPLNGRPIFAGQPFAQSHNLDGFNGGAVAGCDYQFGAWVVGVEGDWSVMNKSGQGHPTLNTINPGISGPGALLIGGPAPYVEAQERWYATARARAGYAVDRWLFFVSGGAAWTKVDYSQFMLCGTAVGASAAFSLTATCSTNAAGYFALDSTKRTGWTVGAGVEYAPTILKGNWTVRAEYLYVDFGSFTTFNAPLVGPGVYDGTALSTRLNNHILRFGLAYKFGPNSAAQFR